MKKVWKRFVSFCKDVEDEYPRFWGMCINMIMVATAAFIFLETETAALVSVLFNIFSGFLHICIEGMEIKEVLTDIGESICIGIYGGLVIIGCISPIIILGILFG